MNGGNRSLIQKALILREKVDLCSKNPNGCSHQPDDEKILNYQQGLQAAFDQRLWEDPDQSKEHKERTGYADICKNYLRHCVELMTKKLFKNGSSNPQFYGAMAFFSCVPFREQQRGKNIVRGFINWEEVWKKKNGQDGGLNDTLLNSGICTDPDRKKACPKNPTQKECQDCIGRLLASLPFSSTPLLDDVLPHKGVLHFPQSPLIKADDSVCEEVYSNLSQLKKSLTNSSEDPLLTGLTPDGIDTLLSKVPDLSPKESIEYKTLRTLLQQFIFGPKNDTSKHWSLISLGASDEDEPWAHDNAGHLVNCKHPVVRPDGQKDLVEYKFSDFLDIPLSLFVLPQFRNFYAFNILLSDLSTETTTFSGGGKGSLILYDLSDNSKTLSAEQMAALFIVANEAMTSLAMYEHKLLVDAELLEVKEAAFRNTGHTMRRRCDYVAKYFTDSSFEPAWYSSLCNQLRGDQLPGNLTEEQIKYHSYRCAADALSRTFLATQLWGFSNLNEVWNYFSGEQEEKRTRFFHNEPRDIMNLLNSLLPICTDSHSLKDEVSREESSYLVSCLLTRDTIQEATLNCEIFDSAQGEYYRLSDDVLSAVFYEILSNVARYGADNQNSREELAGGGRLAKVHVSCFTFEVDTMQTLLLVNKAHHDQVKYLPRTPEEVPMKTGKGIGIAVGVLRNLGVGNIWHWQAEDSEDESPLYCVAVGLKGLHIETREKKHE